MTAIEVRLAHSPDREPLALLLNALWPDSSIDEHGVELSQILAGNPPSTLPMIELVAVNGETIIGFAEVGLRSHADGCEADIPVGYLEGWYVAPGFRRQGIGSMLLLAAQEWARSRGCTEMASDALIDNQLSQTVHARLGVQVVDCCVHYRKKL
jgi:aminoglycoside 6'-N-acetyltransferase I